MYKIVIYIMYYGADPRRRLLYFLRFRFYSFFNAYLLRYNRRKLKKLNRYFRKQEKKYLSYWDKHFPRILTIVFGVPGSGKTTYAAAIAKRALKHGLRVYSNVPITGALSIEPAIDVGIFDISNGILIIDEASVEYNNRKFKSFSDEARYFYKYHRHFNTSVFVFSQGYDDMDKTLRVLAQKLFLVRRSIIPFFTFIRPMKKKIDIDEFTHEPKDMFYWDWLHIRWIFNPLYWKLFNTLSHKKLPYKEYVQW